MIRRFNFYTICLLFGASILLIIQYTDRIYYKSTERQTNLMIIKKNDTAKDSVSIPMENISEIKTGNHCYGYPDNNMTSIPQDEARNLTDITFMLEKARLKIKYDTANYNFSKNGFNVLEDLVIESGGQPLRSLIISTWRSGSTFIGDLVTNAHPSTYYQYEPLFTYGYKQFRTPQEGIEPVSILKRIFKCNYKGLEDYFECERRHFRKGMRSTRMWDYCKYGNNSGLCFNADFASRLCKLFPFLNMKEVRLRLRLVQEILDDKTLNVKVILLVRDPRGVMQSRLHHHACKPSVDCWDPFMLCADMVSDYVAAGQLLQQYPDRLMVVRFEELALQINITSDQILKFLKVQRTQAFDEFLQSHTNVDAAGAHSTSRVSRNVSYKWKNALDFKFVSEIQMACGEAMNLWGYKMAHNETHMTSENFNPVEDYTIH